MHLKLVAAACVLTLGVLAAPGSIVGAPVQAEKLLVYSLDYPGGLRLVGEAGKTRKLTSHGYEPRWSPNGLQIAFLSDRGLPPSHACNREEGNVPDCPEAIYVINADGSGLRRITKHVVYHVDSFSWSPDSRRIAFVAYDGYPDGPVHVYVTNADGSRTRRLTRARGSESSPAWSPDGRWIALVSSYCGLCRVAANGVEQRRVRRADAGSPFWSPDGLWIGYSRWPSPSPMELSIIRPNGQGDRQLTRIFSLTLAATWAPNGRRLAFMDRGLETIGVDGKNRRRLDPRAAFFYPPSWSSDGQEIAYTLAGGGVWVIRADGSERRRVTKPGYSPQWRPLP